MTCSLFVSKPTISFSDSKMEIISPGTKSRFLSKNPSTLYATLYAKCFIVKVPGNSSGSFPRNFEISSPCLGISALILSKND